MDDGVGQDSHFDLLDVKNSVRLPRTMIVTAGFDPICDEGRAYAEVLHKLDIDVRLFHYETLFHGFAFMTKLRAAGTAVNDFLIEYKKVLRD